MGPSTAALTVVEFADFQCPACKQLHILLKRYREKYPNDFAISYHYVPLPYHPMAYPAARAAECAAAQGRFEQYHDQLFAHSSNLKTADFPVLAEKVGVTDLEAFKSCVARTDSVARIKEDIRIASQDLKITGTPTTLVNGKMYSFAPGVGDFQKMIDEAIAKRKTQ